MKSGVQPWMGCAAKAGCEALGDPSGLRSVATPEASNPAASGSASTIFTSGIAAFRALPAPVRKSSISRSLLSRIATQVCAVESTSSTVARHPVRELLARRLEVRDDLGAGRGLVELPAVRKSTGESGYRERPPSTRKVEISFRTATRLASFSNWWQRNQPFLAQSSSALRTMPVPLPAFGVTMTLAPSMRMRRRRSTEKGSAMQMTQS